MHWKGYYGRLTATTVSAETPSRSLKASRWAGNVGELAKQCSPISSLLLAAFTLLPYYRVYRSAFTPLAPRASLTHAPGKHAFASQRGGKWGGKNKQRKRADSSRTRLQLPALPAEGASSECARNGTQMHVQAGWSGFSSGRAGGEWGRCGVYQGGSDVGNELFILGFVCLLLFLG